MATSKKRIAANRRNAKKSTGPKTEAGKAVASRNATTHGAFAHDLIIRSPYLEEDPAEYGRLLASVTAELQPKTALQECLVRKIANCLWRSRRLVAAETAHILKEHHNLPYKITHYDSCDVVIARIKGTEIPKPTDEEMEERFTILAAINSVPDQETTRHLLYYEMRLDRQLTRAYKLLKELKRSAQLTPADAAPDPCPAQISTEEPQREPSVELPKTNPFDACPPTT